MPNLATRVSNLGVQVGDRACKVFVRAADEDGEPDHVRRGLDGGCVPLHEGLGRGEGPVGKVKEVGLGGGLVGRRGVEGGEAGEVGL